MSKVWFITGASRGFGRAWAQAALARGDRVAATARDVSALDDLVVTYRDQVLARRLDVTDRAAAFAAVRAAYDHFGRLDVVVNNAGYGQFGMIEEISEAEARAQLETNFFGALWVTQAALPYLRAQGFGHILQVSSISGVSAFPHTGMYAASKWALEGFSQSLSQEVAPFGIQVTLIEPTGYATDWSGISARTATPLPAYAEFLGEVRAARGRRNAGPGDPSASAVAVLQVVEAAEPPLRILFGDGPLAVVTADYEARLATWREWEPVSVAAHGVKQRDTPTQEQAGTDPSRRWAHNADVISEFRANAGRVAGRFATVDLALLTTTGARTGLPRTTPVGYFTDLASVFVIASAAGSDTHPGWYRNLTTDPKLTVELGAETYRATATEVTDPEEYEHLFAVAIARQPGFAAYRAKAERQIPILRLTPAGL